MTSKYQRVAEERTETCQHREALLSGNFREVLQSIHSESPKDLSLYSLSYIWLRVEAVCDGFIFEGIY